MSSNGRDQMRMQGPRPAVLRVGNSSMKKKSSKVNKPVIIYLRSPKIIHVRPEEFKSLVQRLTGKASPLLSCENEEAVEAEEAVNGKSLVQRLTGKASPLLSCENVEAVEAEEAVKGKKSAFNEVEFGIGMSPTWRRFLACV